MANMIKELVEHDRTSRKGEGVLPQEGGPVMP